MSDNLAQKILDESTVTGASLPPGATSALDKNRLMSNIVKNKNRVKYCIESGTKEVYVHEVTFEGEFNFAFALDDLSFIFISNTGCTTLSPEETVEFICSMGCSCLDKVESGQKCQ